MTVLDRFRLDGDVALVTGAAGGIGGAIAAAMAEAGADVALVDVDEAGVIDRANSVAAETGAETLAITADVSDADAVDRMVAETVDALGGLDVVFANAGVARLGGPVDRYDMDAWDEVMAVNQRGVMLTNRAAAAEMRESGGGRIVNTASVLGLRGTTIPGIGAYATAKGGVIQLTRQLAAELARHDVRVNAIAPGWIETGMTEGFVPPSPDDEGGLRNAILETIPLGRLGEPADLQGVALFLASEASAYATGEVVTVDGGMTAVH